MRAISLVFLSTVFSTAAFAADPGTYRPGMAYGSVPASEPGICEAQCSGDAQCRGWNFVKVNPRLQTGVCEFNAQDAAPVPSPYSISGDNRALPRSAAIIPGRSNTVRVGDIGGSVTPPTTVTQQSPTRRIVREAVPNQIQPRTAATRTVTPNDMQHLSLTEQQNLQRRGNPRPQMQPQPSAPRAAVAPQPRPHFQHNLDAQQQQQQMMMRQQQMHQQPIPQQQPQQHHMARAQNPAYQNQSFAGDPRLQQRLMQQQQMQMQQQQQMMQPNALPPQSGPYGQAAPQLSEQGQSTPPLGNPAAQRQPILQRPAMARPAPNVPAEMGPRAAQGQAMPMTAAEAQSSLFGSLYDDVKIPRPIDPRAFAANPDAPIPTVANVPTRPISQTPLPRAQDPSLAGLAGAAR